MTNEEFKEWQQELWNEEMQNDIGWWYLSFARENNFLGGCFVEAQGILTAAFKANQLHINPHDCQVAGWALRELPAPYKDLTNKLLTKEELNKRDVF